MTRKLSIQYGSLTILDGVAQVHGMTSLGLSFDGISFTFDIAVSSDDAAAFAAAISSLESGLRKRDQALSISGWGHDWGTYTPGVNALNTSAAINKAGDIDSDTGLSRVYSVTFSAEHAADDDNGLRAINAQLDFAPTRQRSVSISGEYTALNGDLAKKNYDDHVMSKVNGILDYIDNGATWERQSEQATWDRNNHILQFQQVWLEQIHNDTESELDDPAIVSHRCVFTRTSAYPGDAECSVNKPETVVAEYSAFVNIDEVGNDLPDLDNLYEEKILPWLKKQIDDAWSPKGIGLVQQNRHFDVSGARFSARLTYQMYMSGSDLIESTKTEAYEDTRTPDYTPVWNDDELAAYVDQGFMVRLRTNTKTETRFGSHVAGPLLKPGNVKKSGWNKLHGSHSAQPLCIGEGDDSVEVTILIESIMERFTRAPSGGGGGDTVPAYDVPGQENSAEITPSDIERSQQITRDRIAREVGDSRLPGSRDV